MTDPAPPPSSLPDGPTTSPTDEGRDGAQQTDDFQSDEARDWADRGSRA